MTAERETDEEREDRLWLVEYRKSGKDRMFNHHVATRQIELVTCRMLASLRSDLLASWHRITRRVV